MTDLAYMRTWSGNKFYFRNPEPTSILIEDIAHSLSLQCRFNGHCDKHYSVPEHSVKVANKALDESPEDYRLALTALLHDAAETYTGDIVSPLKAILPDFKNVERRVEICISQRFGLTYPLPDEVKRFDKEVLSDEFVTIAPFSCDSGGEPLSPKEAERVFLDMFYKLQKSLLDDDKSK